METSTALVRELFQTANNVVIKGAHRDTIVVVTTRRLDDSRFVAAVEAATSFPVATKRNDGVNSNLIESTSPCQERTTCPF